MLQERLNATSTVAAVNLADTVPTGKFAVQVGAIEKSQVRGVSVETPKSAVPGGMPQKLVGISLLAKTMVEGIEATKAILHAAFDRAFGIRLAQPPPVQQRDIVRAAEVARTEIVRHYPMIGQQGAPVDALLKRAGPTGP